jgi:hypothetical protein
MLIVVWDNTPTVTKKVVLSVFVRFRERGELETHHLSAYGVYVGMNAAKQQFGSDVLSGKKY